jgi:predicted methyltransferase
MLKNKTAAPAVRSLCTCVSAALLMLVLAVFLLAAFDAQPNGIPVRDVLIWMATGVFQSTSSDIDAEINVLARMMDLRPGLTICEMGSADGRFLSLLGARVMPGGSLRGTAPDDAELKATMDAAAAADMGDATHVYKATDQAWAPGLPPSACDVVYSRMVYHMLDKSVATRYVPQWREALKPGGTLLVLDHNPCEPSADQCVTSGPRRPMEGMPMVVVPQETEVAEIVAGGFELRAGPFPHPFYEFGYGAVYAPA